MNKICLTTLFALFTILSIAQSNNFDFRHGLKVYNMTSYQKNTEQTIYDNAPSLSSNYEVKSFQFLQPTIAFLWNSEKHNFHEVELTSLRFGKNDALTELYDDSNGSTQIIQGSSDYNVDISMRYEFILNLAKSKDWKLMPFIGFGANPYFNRISLTPKTSNLYPLSTMQTGIRGFVVPRLTYFINSKVFLDLNVPFCITDFNIERFENNNPSLTEEERVKSTLNFRQFPNRFSVRLGVGLKL